MVGDGVNTIKHELACDNDPAMQRWIQRTRHSEILISEISDLEFKALKNLNSNSCSVRPSSTIAICGWSCCTAFEA